MTVTTFGEDTSEHFARLATCPRRCWIVFELKCRPCTKSEAMLIRVASSRSQKGKC